LAKTIRLTPKEYLSIINDPRFYIKHQSFCKKIKSEISNNQNKILSKDLANNTIENLNFFEKELKKSEQENNNKYFDLFELKEANYQNQNTQKITEKMDDIYKNYIALKEIRQENPADTRTQ